LIDIWLVISYVIYMYMELDIPIVWS